MPLEVIAENDVKLCKMRQLADQVFVEAHITMVIEKAASRARAYPQFIVLHKPSPDWLDNRELERW